jgi:hypothetical protein
METEDDSIKPKQQAEEQHATSAPMELEDVFKPDDETAAPMELEEPDKPHETVESTPTPPPTPPPTPMEWENNEATTSEPELPQEVSKSINTVMDFVSSKIANKINVPFNEGEPNIQNIQNGFDAVNEAAEKMSSTQTEPKSQSQNAGKKKKFRLTKKSRGQAK